jgi:hypothetical protein
MGLADKNTGAQYDILDIAVANRLRDLASRQHITVYDYREFQTDYNQLVNFATMHSDVKYIREKWSTEEPRYAGWPERLRGKIVDEESTDYLSIMPTRKIADPRNYDFTLSLSGGSNNGNFPCGPCCGGSDSGKGIDYKNPNPDKIAPRGGNSFLFAASPGKIDSLGDLFRNLLTPQDIPLLDTPYPDNPNIDQHEIIKGIITAVIIGGVLYVIHRATQGTSLQVV